MHHHRNACDARTSASIDDGQRRDERALPDPDLDEAADEQEHVERHHERVVRVPVLHAAVLPAPPQVALRDDQLGDPLEGDQDHQDGEGDEPRHHCSSTSSAQNPGPMAITMPGDPSAGRLTPRPSMVSPQHVQHRRRRQVADARQRTPRHVELAVVEVEGGLHRLEHPWTARVRHPRADVRRLELVVDEEVGDVVAEIPADDLGHAGRQHDAEAAGADVPAHRALGVGVQPAARRDHGRAAAAPSAPRDGCRP